MYTQNHPQEHPIVTALDFDLQGKGTHCSHCLRHIQKGMVSASASDRLNSVFCSSYCQLKSQAQSENLVFSLEPPLPQEVASVMTPEATKQRDAAQAAYVNYVNKHGKAALLLAARFMARQVTAETAKMMPPGSAPLQLSDLPNANANEGGYTLVDHLERLRYLEVNVPEEEVKLFADVMAAAVPGLEQYVTDERYAIMYGKMAYNAFGICFGDGRGDKVTFRLYLSPETLVYYRQSTAHFHGKTRGCRKDTDPIRNFKAGRKWNVPGLSICIFFCHFCLRTHHLTYTFRLLIHVPLPPTLPLSMAPPKCTSLPIVHSPRATKSQLRTLMFLNTQMNLRLKRGDADGWN